VCVGAAVEPRALQVGPQRAQGAALQPLATVPVGGGLPLGRRCTGWHFLFVILCLFQKLKFPKRIL
jgi:hypothetical protein